MQISHTNVDTIFHKILVTGILVYICTCTCTFVRSDRLWCEKNYLIWKSYTSSGICKKGLAICSILSEGHTRTTAVPRHTTRPRFLVWSVILKGSSGSAGGVELQSLIPSINAYTYIVYTTNTCMAVLASSPSSPPCKRRAWGRGYGSV